LKLKKIAGDLPAPFSEMFQVQKCVVNYPLSDMISPVKICQQMAILPSKGNHLLLASHWSSRGTS